MRLIKIAASNVESSLSMYKLYLLSLVFTVLLFFSFISLNNNPMVKQLEEVIIFESMVMTSLFVMMVFVFFFLMFSAKFFIAERKKEIGLYVMTGTSKRKIALMVAIENMMMYLIAIVIGSVLGVLLNKFFVMIITDYLNMGITIDFYVSFDDLMVTALVFVILGLLTSLRGFELVNRKKVIDLLKGKNKEETMPKGNIPIGIISLVIIGMGYYAAMQMNSEGLLFYALQAVIGVIAGTFLFYRSVMTMFFKSLMKHERFVYKKNRLLVFSNLWYRIGNNYKVYAAVTIFLTCTLTAISTAASFNYSFDDLGRTQYPYSIYIEDDGQGTMYDKVLMKLDEMDINTAYSNKALESYRLSGIKNDVWRFDYTMNLVSESTYRRNMNNIPFVTKEAVLPKETLKEDEVYFVNNPSSYITLGSIRKIFIGEDTYKVLWSNRAPLFGMVTGDSLVVNDQIYDHLRQSQPTEIQYFSGIMLENEEGNETLMEIFEAPEYQSKVTVILESNRETTMMVLIRLFFIFGIFLAIAFILATGSIVYFKIVSQAGEDTRTFELLHDMGLARNKINGVIHRQTFMFFLIPLLLASVHTYAASCALERFLGISLLVPLGSSIVLVGAIFFMYYLVTMLRYKRIVLIRQ